MNDQNRRSAALFPIGYVSRATGLSTHVIRAWERRYGIITPARSSKNRRLYTQKDLDCLILLKHAVAAGHSISQLAGLDRATLAGLAQPTAMRYPVDIENRPDQTHSQIHLEACLSAVTQLDAKQLEQCLSTAAVALPRISLLTEVIAPLLDTIGDLWAAGSIKVVHEHAASAVIHGILWEMLRTGAPSRRAPAMVVTTPAGQWCDLGALMAAIVASECGWSVHYFGPSLPSDEIVAAAWKKQAQAVALSIAYQIQELHLARELKKVRQGVSDHVRLFVGGHGSENYRHTIAELGGIWLPDLKDFVSALA